jgi:type VI secretion system protein ImpK
MHGVRVDPVVGPAMNDLATLLPPQADPDQLAQALHAAARPLIVLATQLRRAVVLVPEDMKRALAAAVARFEHDMAVAGWDERGISAASYLLCVWVDEVVADTPWGTGGAGLLERFHAEREGSMRILRLLSRLAEQPRENRALLELFHVCLSLGLTGHLRGAPDGARQVETLRSRVFLALPRDTPTLAPPWHSAVAARPRALPRRVALGALVLLGLAALGIYTASQLTLAAQADKVFASMQQIAAAHDAPRAPAAALAPRLAPLLAADIAAGTLSVRDESHRSLISVPSERLFARTSTHVTTAGTALLARVAKALAGIDGKVLVVGHTDGSDIRDARLPSAWHQSYEWARAAAESLGHTLPAERLTIEGAADQQAGAEPDLPRRRVDFVLYP